MRFQLLGPVRAVGDDGPIDLGVRGRRFVFAVLLLSVNSTVRTERLIALLWPDGPPPSATGSVHSHVSHLRRHLAAAGAERHGVSLLSAGSGYELRCDPALVDAHRFRALVRDARCQADERRAETLEAALALWQGSALSDVTTDELRAAMARPLEEARLAAGEDLMEARLRLGRHHEVVEAAVALVIEEPLRPRLVGQYMLALHRAERTAEALRVYRETERVLVEESGLDPSPELSRLHQRILTGDPTLLHPNAGARPTPVQAVPRQLPRDVGGFVGRVDALSALDAAHASRATGSGSAAGSVIAVTGGGGVGKTSLVVRWAHRNARLFPDGQLFVDLRGHSAGQPAAPTEVLATLIRGLGTPSAEIPDGEHERAALYRSVLADRRVLVVLDNAADPAQVRPLLPGSGACTVLITSRNGFGGLVAGEGAQRHALGVLPPDEGVALLVGLLGVRRSSAEHAQLAELARRCGGLPLALRIAAANLLSHPGRPVGVYLDDLTADGRLDVLTVDGDEETAVRATFELSYDRLRPVDRAVFRLLGLHPGVDLDLAAAAALVDADPADLRRRLDSLACAHLIEETGRDRFRMHDLLRAYAAERAAAECAERVRRDALTRLFDHYVSATALAMAVVAPRENEPPPGGGAVPSPEAAREWLDAERANLVAAAVHCADHGRPAHTRRLARLLHRYLEAGAHHDEARTVHRRALDGAAGADRVHPLLGLGSLAWRLGHHAEALDHLTEALVTAREVGDAAGEGRALTSLGVTHELMGGYQTAVEHHEQALAIVRRGRDRFAEGVVACNLGGVYARLGRLTEAISYHELDLAICRELGDRRGEAMAMGNLGCAYQWSGDGGRALDLHRRSLAIFGDIGATDVMARAHGYVGQACEAVGLLDDALEHLRRARDLAGEVGDRHGEVEALNGIGRTLWRLGSAESALRHHREALARAVALGDRHESARAHEGVADVLAGTGDHHAAHDHRVQAGELYAELGVNEAVQEKCR